MDVHDETGEPQERFDALIECLYDCVLSTDGFQTFIEKLASVFDLKGVGVLIRHHDNREVVGVWNHGVEPRWRESYLLTYGPEDVLATLIDQSPIGQFYASNLHLPAALKIEETRFYREWAAPQGVAYAAGCIVMREGPWVTQAFLQRTDRHGPFSTADLRDLNRLIPHWQRATQLRQRLVDLRTSQDLLAASLDVIAMPTFLFDESGRLVHRNRSADALKDMPTLLWFDAGRLLTSSPQTTRNVHLQIGNALRFRGDSPNTPIGVVPLRRAGRSPLTMMVVPVRNKARPAARGGALLFVFDPETTPAVDTALIERLFDFTPAEARLAASLCAGLSPEEIAAERGRAISTIRTQLRSLLAKTGTTRQADLIGLLLASPAYFVAQSVTLATPVTA